MLDGMRTRLRNTLGRIPSRLLVPMLLAIIGLVAYYASFPIRFEYHYSAANRAFEKETYEEAGTHLAACIQLDPRSGRAHFLAARTARRAAQYDQAKEELDTCAELGWPGDALLAESSLLAFQQGNFNSAAENYLRRQVTPDNPERFLFLEAIAQGYLRVYRLVDALECLDLWLKEQPDAISARMRRGWVYERLNRFEEALADYRHVVEQSPRHAAARLRMARIHLQLGDAALALPIYEVLNNDSKPGEKEVSLSLGYAQSLARVGRGGEAQALLDEIIAKHPKAPAPLIERGKLALGTGDLDQARDLLQKAATFAPEDYDVHFQLFLCYQRRGESAQAKQAEAKFKSIEADLNRMNELTEKIQQHPQDAELRFRVAEIFLRRHEEREGIHWLHTVLNLDPGHVGARRLLAEAYDRAGRPNLARTYGPVNRP